MCVCAFWVSEQKEMYVFLMLMLFETKRSNVFISLALGHLNDARGNRASICDILWSVGIFISANDYSLLPWDYIVSSPGIN